MAPHYLVKSKKSVSTINHLDFSHLQLDKFSEHEICFFFTNQKLFTMAALQTFKIIWYAWWWHPRSMTYALAITMHTSHPTFSEFMMGLIPAEHDG